MLLVTFACVRPTARSGIKVGLYWLVINVGLDLLILVPITKMRTIDYLYDIGLRYLLIPIVGLALGVVAERAAVETSRTSS